MIWATCCNCWPMLVVGNVVLRGVDFASAEARAAASLMLFLSVSLAACTRLTPLSVESRVLMAVMPEAGPTRFIFDPGARATGCVCAPIPSREFPATEKNGGKFEVLTLLAAM